MNGRIIENDGLDTLLKEAALTYLWFYSRIFVE
jgi:hypothetical protein